MDPISSLAVSAITQSSIPLPSLDLVTQATSATDPNKVAVINEQYCSPTPMELIVKKLTLNNYEIKDIKGDIVFKVNSEFPYYQGRKVIRDSAGNPILSMQRKIPSAHSRWQAYKGNSKDPRDVMFSAKQPSVVQFSTALDVYMVDNKEETICDYRVKGSLIGRSCTIYKGETNTVLAQMHEQHSIQSVVLGSDTFVVTVYPQVDHAFIAAVIVVLDSVA